MNSWQQWVVVLASGVIFSRHRTQQAARDMVAGLAKSGIGAKVEYCERVAADQPRGETTQ